MTTWTKIEKNRPSVRKERTLPAVTRSRTGARSATIVLPKSHALNANAADVYSDGNGKLAFAPRVGGKFKVQSYKGNALQRVSIPIQFAPRIPFGTTDAALTADGDMIVLDLDQFSPTTPSKASETVQNDKRT